MCVSVFVMKAGTGIAFRHLECICVGTNARCHGNNTRTRCRKRKGRAAMWRATDARGQSTCCRPLKTCPLDFFFFSTLSSSFFFLFLSLTRTHAPSLALSSFFFSLFPSVSLSPVSCCRLLLLLSYHASDQPLLDTATRYDKPKPNYSGSSSSSSTTAAATSSSSGRSSNSDE